MVAEAGRVLVVDDDEDLVQFVRTLLERRAGCIVRTARDGASAIAEVSTFQPDVVVADIEMPGMSGLEMLEAIRVQAPWMPVVIMTAHVSVDYAVLALRSQADEFLTKPLDTAGLVATVERLILEGRARRGGRARKEIVLAVGAHPDDVEIGVGGTLAAHQAAGDEITILTLTRGSRGGDADLRQHEALSSAELLGARLFLKDLIDTEVPIGGPTVRLIEEVVNEIGPTIVYTHTSHDRHQDHRAVHDATMVATRNVETIACYQSPSSTIDFRPTRFVSIDGFMDRKLDLLACFGSQADRRTYLAPEFVTTTARYWSRFGDGDSVEPLEMVKDTAGLASAVDRVEVEP